MEFIKEKNGVYYFKDSEGNKHAVGADSQQDALDKLAQNQTRRENKEANRDYKAELREKLTLSIELKANELLNETKYDVDLHLEEQLRGKGTTKTNEEIQLILDNRASIRQQRDDMIASLPDLKSIGKLEKFKIVFSV